MVKKLLIILALIILGIASYVTNKFIMVQGIRYVYFIPTILCIRMLVNTQKPSLKEVAITIFGGLIYIWCSNLFSIDPTMNDGIWCLVGGVIAYLLTLLYGYAKREGAKQTRKEMTVENQTENEKNN